MTQSLGGYARDPNKTPNLKRAMENMTPEQQFPPTTAEGIILKIVNEWGNAKYGMEESRQLPTVEECLSQIHWPDFEPYQKKLITDLIIFAQTTKP